MVFTFARPPTACRYLPEAWRVHLEGCPCEEAVVTVGLPSQLLLPPFGCLSVTGLPPRQGHAPLRAEPCLLSGSISQRLSPWLGGVGMWEALRGGGPPPLRPPEPASSLLR